jgi:uncharacterized membrane protein
MTTETSMLHLDHAREAHSADPATVCRSRSHAKAIAMRKAVAKALTWRLIGTAEIFAISFWTTGHIATAGHTAAIAAVTSVLIYVVHELAWSGSFSRRRVGEWGEPVEIAPTQAGT